MFKKIFRKCALDPISTQSIQQRIYKKDYLKPEEPSKEEPSKEESVQEESSSDFLELKYLYDNLLIDRDKWRKLALEEKSNLNKTSFMLRWLILGMLVLNFVILAVVFVSLSPAKNEDIRNRQKIYPFTVQVAVYSDLDKAKLAVANLKEKGFTLSSICRPLGSKSDYYRVYVGEFETIKDAENIKNQINKFFNFRNIIVRRRL